MREVCRGERVDVLMQLLCISSAAMAFDSGKYTRRECCDVDIRGGRS
jgi:hypothetical protein